jgi:hypothetical protein
MMKVIFIFLLIICSHDLSGQKIIIDSNSSDTIGFSKDLQIIESKLGKLSDSVKSHLVCLEVRYRGFEISGLVDSNTTHKGILMVHKSVKEDLAYVFEELYIRNFPIHKVVPVNKYGLNQDSTGWDDSKSMADNNSSAFNYRYITNSKELSPHAYGTAIDINPLFNPYEKYEVDGKFTEPDNAIYNCQKTGTITDTIVTGLFDKIGWIWGGRWNNPVDYQHFDLRKKRGQKHYLMKENSIKNWFRYDEQLKIIFLYPSVENKKKNIPELTVNQKEVEQFDQICKIHGLDNIKIKWKNKEKITTNSNEKPRVLLISENKELNETKNNILSKLRSLLEKNGIITEYSSISETENKKFDLVLRLNLDIHDSDKISPFQHQIIYVPGAFKEKDLFFDSNRYRFFNLLIGEDLQKSIDAAILIQKEINSKCKIEPINRYDNEPELLEKDCIKTDFDGIYCRNDTELNKYCCPSIFIQITLKNILSNNPLHQEFANTENIIKAISEGIRNYFKNKS